MLTWTIEPVVLDLKYTWKISRNATDQKTNLIVTASDGIKKGTGEAAPNIRYHESAEEGIKLFSAFVEAAPEEANDISELHTVIKKLKLFPSLAFAIESAWFSYKEAKEKKSFYELTGIEPPGEIITSYTIPIMDTGKMKKFYEENRLSRFPFIKLKVNSENAYESLRHLLSFCNNPVMLDANESFTDVEQCIYWLEKIQRMPLVLVEQLLPANMKDESAYMKKYCPFKIFADESVTDHADFSEIRKSFDGINMKLMKAGGILNGIQLLKEAKKNNLMTMIGCMVETTLGISTAMKLCSLADYADLDSFLLLKKEPFGLAEEKDGALHFKGTL
jgi:L-alanine-DL-glutamate epimerase-like enolase superfamily enzyme